jgi:hypothetical protein
MSISIDYFFNHHLSLQGLASQVNVWLGCALGPYDTDPSDLYTRFLGMEMTLSEHTLEDDGELNFQHFKYCIGIRIPAPDADFRSIQLPVMAYVAYALYRCMLIIGMLVYDLQVLLARYELRKVAEGDSRFCLHFSAAK